MHLESLKALAACSIILWYGSTIKSLNTAMKCQLYTIIKNNFCRRQAKEEVKEAAKLQVVITAGEEVWLLEVERQVVMNQLIRLLGGRVDLDYN